MDKMPLLISLDVQNGPGRASTQPSGRDCGKYERGNSDPISHTLEHALYMFILENII